VTSRRNRRDRARIRLPDRHRDDPRLWAALTSGELTRQYWFDRRIESSWIAGEPVRFHDGASDVVTDSGTVLEAVPYRTLSYSFRQEAAALGTDTPGPVTRVTFTLTPLDDGRVRLLLVHDQLSAPEDVDAWSRGWAPILGNLEALLDKN
jgi:uncharacterized protein YndB with AHSA1/START domain